MPSANASARAIQNFHDKFFDVASSGDYAGTRPDSMLQDIDLLHCICSCPHSTAPSIRVSAESSGCCLIEARTLHTETRAPVTRLHLCARRGDQFHEDAAHAGANRKIEAPTATPHSARRVSVGAGDEQVARRAPQALV